MNNRRSLPNAKPNLDQRLHYLMIGLFLFGALLAGRLAWLQLWSGRELSANAAKQYSTVRILPAERGQILYGEAKSQNLYPLAASRAFQHLYAVPRYIENASTTLAQIYPLLEPFGLARETVMARLSKDNDIYEPLMHKLTDEQIKPILDLQLPGIEAERETWRYYPEKETLSHVIGFVDASDERKGQYGLEGYYDKELRGQDGVVEGDVDISGRLIQTGALKRVESEAGIDLVLTIDRVIQSFACGQLEDQSAKLGAEGGDLIIINPKTGAIIAMCSVPEFDPNNYNKVENISVYLNSNLALPYEPGSIFKPLTMAAAIDAGKVNPNTTYTDTGEIKFGTYTIKNSDNEAHGETTMIGVLEKSLNTGAWFAEQQLGNTGFKKYVEKFGFGRLTGIELGNEAAGNISALNKDRDIYYATASFGQGITTTPLQMVMAYGALANGGQLLKPYIVKEKRRNGEVIERAKTEVLGNPVSLRTSTIISGMLVSVVREGHAKRAAVPGYRIGAKTGTAQVAEGGQYGAKTIHSVTGYGPIDNPAFAMIVKLNDPKAGRFAESTAVPVFGEVAKFLLQYYEIPPDEEVN